MRRIQILDCTLRDGGYQNDCCFGYDNQKKITMGLVEAGIDIIECGFFTNTISYDPNVTRFNSMEQIAQIIPNDREGKLFVVLADYGKYNLEDIPRCSGDSVDGIRVAFHKKDRMAALDDCKAIKEKGYKVFVQAMVSINYSDEEFLDLIKKVNDIKPFAFYIVDSFGMMKNKDLIRLFYILEHNLDDSIWIGFHSHNNIQLAYSNAQSLVNINSERNLIIDSSIYGMGRGAGNLNTELFVEYLNENTGTRYDIKPLLTIIDEILNDFYQRNYWGYSLPNYLSAIHNAHPNYASFLDDKKTLTIGAMNEIFDLMAEDKKFSYDKQYIEELYISYMANGKTQSEHYDELKNHFLDKKVLLIAPGKSSVDEKEIIMDFVKSNDVLSISVNFDYQMVRTDFIFLSNLRRYRELMPDKQSKCIVTSNIPTENAYLQIKYRDLLTTEEAVKDNAGLMAIKFLINSGVREVYLAGFDGYAHDVQENYGDSHMAFITKNVVLDAINIGMNKVLKQYNDQITIHFLTKENHISL